MKDINGQKKSSRVAMYDSNWKLRNTVIRFPYRRHNFNVLAGVTDPNGVGVIENCIIDGGGIFVHPAKHAGDLYIKNCWIRRSPNNGLYAEPTKASGGGTPYSPQGGRVHVGNCYFTNNNISHVRINIGGRVQNTVIHNSNQVSPHFGGKWDNGVINSRGLHTFYGAGSFNEPAPRAENVHVKVTDSNTSHPDNGGSSASSAFSVPTQGNNGVNPIWQLRSCEIVGDIYDQSRFNGQNIGDSPKTDPPEGVPTTDSQALNGSVRASRGLPGGELSFGDSPPDDGNGDDWVGSPPDNGNGTDQPIDNPSFAGFGLLETGAVLSVAYGAYRKLGK